VIVDLLESEIRVGPVGIARAPSSREFLALFQVGAEACRTFPDTGSGNSVNVLDDAGVYFLTATSTGKLVGFGLALEEPKWRRRTDRDPLSLFAGEIAIRGRQLPRPITTSLADVIAKKTFGSIGVRMTPHEGTIASVFVSFSEEEKKGEPGGT